MADERVEKMRPRGMQYWGSLYGYVGGGYIPLNTTTGDVHDLVAAYDELRAAHDREIQEAVISEQNSIKREMYRLLSSQEWESPTEEERVWAIYKMLADMIRHRQHHIGLDPATIRREERERIAAAARDTQRWVGGNYPAWAHEMFRQFASVVENGDIPESKEEGYE